MTKTDSRGVAMEVADPHAATKYASDESVMASFGKKQRFKARPIPVPAWPTTLTDLRVQRNFGFFSVMGLTLSVMAIWEALITGTGPTLSNGGPTGMIIDFCIGWFGAFCQTLVLAEMASMIPLSGGQYNWVAILAPTPVKKFLSYITGWLILMSWNASTAVVFFIAATTIQSCAVLDYGYEPTSWQTALISYAVLLLSLTINIFLGFILPGLEIGGLIAHLVGFFPIFIVMLVGTNPKNDASTVFQLFSDGGGWGNAGLATLVGLSPMLTSFFGTDTAAHMAEEIKDAQRVVPKVMISSMVISGIQGIAMLFAFLFCLGPLDETLDAVAQGTFPIVNILARATGSNQASSGLTIFVLLPTMFAALGTVTTASRTMFAFARENGLPGSKYLSWVPESRSVPIWSVMAIVAIQIVLSTIGIGSTAALQAFFGLAINALYSVFMITAGVMLYVRLTQKDIKWGPFRLGRAGVPITIFALAFSAFGYFWAFWPSALNPDTNTFNWGMVVYLGVVLLALVWWFISARHHYTGPIVERIGEEERGPIQQV